MSDDARTKVLLSVIHLYAVRNRVTCREAAMGAGMSLGRTHDYLNELRELGWVTWENGCTGTLRPLVAEVPEWAA